MVTVIARLAPLWQWLISTFTKATVEFCPKHSNCSLFQEMRVINSLPAIVRTNKSTTLLLLLLGRNYIGLLEKSTIRQNDLERIFPNIKGMKTWKMLFDQSLCICDKLRCGLSFCNFSSSLVPLLREVKDCLGSHKA